MSVKNTHADYDRMAPKWHRCRDVAAGQDAMRAQCAVEGLRRRGGAYIPALHDQTADDYAGYVARAPFYNATWRTISGLVGMLFRKDPQVVVPAAQEELLDDVSSDGTPFDLFCQHVGEEALVVGRVGVLVDYPQAPEGATRADGKVLNLRPILCMYTAEAIINWRMQKVNNKYSLTLVVLTEQAEIQKDEFTVTTETQYRVLDINAGSYRQRLYRVTKDGKDEQIGEDIVPSLGGKPLDYIPFYCMSVDDTTMEVDDPPLIDLVDMNISHWRTTADYEHGCHFAGLPTAVVTGYKPDAAGEKLYIGSATAWIFPNENAKATYLEISGQGLTPLKENMTDKESRMAILGARMLEAQKRGIEATDTVLIHRAGEQSVLASIAMTLSLGITAALKVFIEWAGAADAEVACKINKDFYPVPMDPQMLTALVASWQSGAISSETLFINLQSAEIISPDRTLEEEQASVVNDPVRMPPPAPADPNVDPNTQQPYGAQ